MKTIADLLPPKSPKDSRLTVRIPKDVRVKADKLAKDNNTSLAAVVEAGLKLLISKFNEKA